MKIKKKSIIIPAFALLIGASLAGSVTGTIAWYQYSTRVNVAHYNVSGGASGNLQMRIKKDSYGANGDWISTLSAKEIREYLTSQGYGNNVLPITSGALDKDAAAPADDEFLFNPRVGYGPYSSWINASKGNFIRIPLQLRYIDRDGDFKNVGGNVIDEEEAQKDVYLSDLVLQKDSAQNELGDISEALRFHVYAYQDELAEDSGDAQNPADKIADGSELNHLISKNGGTTIVEGKLDLDGNGLNDRGYTVADKKYGGFKEDSELTEIIYGREYNTYDQNPYVALSQSSYSAGFDVIEKKDNEHADGAVYYDSNNVAQPEKEDIYPAVVEEDEFYDLTNLSYEDEQGADQSKAIGKTIAKDPEAANYDDIKDDYLNVVITVWVEGWHKMVNKTPVLDANNDPVLDGENNPTYTEEISSIWNYNFVDSAFNVGFEFGVDGDSSTL